jgi:HEAT repeat protein
MENNMSKKIEKLSAHYSAVEFIAALKDEDEEVKRYALSTIVKKLYDMLAVQVADDMGGLMNQPVMAGLLTRGQLSAKSEGLSKTKASQELDEKIQIEYKEAVEPLMGLLNHMEPDVRHDAARALGIIGDKTASEALKNILNDEDVKVRKIAKWAYDKMN